MVTVRPAGPADAEDVVRVQVGGWHTAYAGIMPDGVLASLDRQRPQRIARTRERLSTTGAHPFSTVVATEDDHVIGFATYGPYRLEHEVGSVDDTVGEVLAIYVDKAYQGRGAGRVLLDTAVAALRGRGVREVRLWVLEENAPARRFYERYGFAADGDRHYFRVEEPDGNPVDLPEVRYTLSVR
jgi:ribosomal protein S18 acetylase RimI-like enzyme